MLECQLEVLCLDTPEPYPDETNADDEEEWKWPCELLESSSWILEKIDLRLVYFFYFLQLLDNFY